MMDKLIKSNMMNTKIWNKVKNDDLQLIIQITQKSVNCKKKMI